MKSTFSKGILTLSLALALLLGLASRMQSGWASTASGDSIGETLRQEAFETYMQLPLTFIANRGQQDESVAYYVQGGGHSIYFTADKVVLALRHGSGQALGETVLRVRFVGAEATQPVGVEEKAARVNYFIGNDPARWRTDIPAYGQVIYHELYPGIVLRYAGQTGALKYTFVVRPGADVSQIRLAYDGADGLRVDETGDLLIQADGRELRDTRPYAYQEIGGRRVEVDVAFALHDLYTCGFVVQGSYDPHYPLVIDPTLYYATYLGGSGDDQGYGIAVDGAGSVYVTGMTWSANFPTKDAYQGDQLHKDAFVAKIDTTKSGDASLVYATYLGGSSTEWGNDIAVDGDGNAYLTGITTSTDFPVINGFQSGSNDARRAFVTKLNAAGNGLHYSTCVGYRSGLLKDTEGYGIAVDGDGHAYATGVTYSETFFTTENAYQKMLVGPADAFVVRIDTTRNGLDSLLYATYLGGNGNDQGYSIAVDGAGHAYVTGETYSTDFPTRNASQGDQESWDVFVTKIDTTKSGDASLVYSTYLGGGGDDHGQGIAVDGAGHAYVTGYTYSTNFPPQNPYQVDQPVMDAFVTKLNPSGNALVYSTYLGGSSWDEGHDIAVDGDGNVYVTGYTQSIYFPIRDPYQAANAGNDDAFVTKIDTTQSGDASLVYSTYLGGGSDDHGQSIAVDGNGNAYVTGNTESTNFPTQSPYQDTYGGGNYDAFVARFSPDRSDLSTSSKQVSPVTIVPTGTVTHTLHYTITLANTGALTATTACLTDTLPSGLSLTIGPACSGGTCGYNAGSHVITWTGSLAPGASAAITYSGLVSVPIGTEDTIYFVNTAQVDDETNAPFTITARSAVNPRYIYVPIVLKNF